MLKLIKKNKSMNIDDSIKAIGTTDVSADSGGGVYLCKCNMCGNILIDNNPLPDAVLYEYRNGLGELAQLEDVVTGEIYWGCPNCQTDDYLIDK